MVSRQQKAEVGAHTGHGRPSSSSSPHVGDPRALRDPGRIALSAQRRRCGSRLPAPPPLDRRRPTPCTAGPPARTRSSWDPARSPACPCHHRRPSVLTPGRRRVPSGSQIHSPRAWRGGGGNLCAPPPTLGDPPEPTRSISEGPLLVGMGSEMGQRPPRRAFGDPSREAGTVRGATCGCSGLLEKRLFHS